MNNTVNLIIRLAVISIVAGGSICAQTVTIEPMPNNTEFDDFAPSITNHGKVIIYSTDRSGKGQRLMSMEQTNGAWSASRPLSGDVNDSEHSGVGALTPDGQSMIFSSTNHDVQGSGRTDLYMARKRNGSWRDVTSLGSSVNSASYDAQPSLSSDGRTLYFVSDRPGGQGASDIYTSTWDGSEWSIAIPVAGVNSPSGEMSPVIAPDGRTLYFA
ncbi:MAG: hypothetical protein FGM33_09720, partial [Candidatus Kapabacteria bacterium]|nr:hypothetical protein [Candidatus Kapabacteria bacterium]